MMHLALNRARLGFTHARYLDCWWFYPHLDGYCW